MLERLARFSSSRRRSVLAAWIVLLVALFVIASSTGTTFRNNNRLAGSDSQAALDLLSSRGFRQRTGIQAQVVFSAAAGVEDPSTRTVIEPLLARIQRASNGAQMVSPYDANGARQISRDRRIAYAELDFADRDINQYTDVADAIKNVVDRARTPGVDVELGGQIFSNQGFPASEAIGVAAAILILLFAFGSVLAMGLPIVTALFGIGCGVAVVQLITHVIDIPDFTTQASAVIGIGVGIDYALLIVTRHREALHAGRTPEDSIVHAIDTAGRSVLFAGTTVIVSLMGLFTMGLPLVHGLAVGASLAVLLVMIASVTLLPALLGFAGHAIDRLSVPHRRLRAGALHQTLGHRWSRVVQRAPWRAGLAALGILLVLAVPVTSLRLGVNDAGNYPASDTTRRAYDLIAKGFGPGFNGPLLVSARLRHGAQDLEVIEGLAERVGRTRGVASVAPVRANDDQTAAILQVFPKTSPQDKATTDLVNRLRDRVVPAAIPAGGPKVFVGGITAAAVDFSHYTATRLPIFIGAVLVLSFLLLMAVFRSVLVPLKAVVMNLLSIGAAYGVIVAVFQWGWGSGVFGVGKEGPVEAWAPMMLFAVIFGLSMDYEVFLLARIREEYDRSGDNGLAVANGLALTARVITAAAAIMVAVFLSFAAGSTPGLKIFGLGMSVAVFVDATLVRMVLVPATMELLGDRNWWMPRWLDRLLPTVHIEAAELERELDALRRGEPVGAGRE
jgi:RND superfamily putative drug exporter